MKKVALGIDCGMLNIGSILYICSINVRYNVQEFNLEKEF